ncbi:MAG: hypothetical protein A3B68_08275 [Candidatus Melainabacteria bacterium RIFCSPHIGHO2_02_FULL_34_12]|nr:MAG: hypothetical protein A3B68_08275 [Candidatus Melainabacteria bacterium RIFCSPHIGHO2_02_FULL_34_12]
MKEKINNLPFITVIIPYYNSRFDHFKEAIKSILAQSYANWEAIIVNDGSTVEHKLFLDDCIQELNDKRISVVHLKENSGPSVAKNTGIEAAKGEIITFLDSDDLLLPWFLKKITDAFIHNPNIYITAAGYVFYLHFSKIKKLLLAEVPYNSLNEEDKSTITILDEIKKAKLFLPVQLSFKKEVFKTIRFDPEFRLSEDGDLCFQILNNNSLLEKTLILHPTGYMYRIYPSKDRLTHKTELRFSSRIKLISKYTGEESLAAKAIKRWQSSLDDWKFAEQFLRFTNNGSVINYFKTTFDEFKDLKDRIKSIRGLITLILRDNFLISVFGIDTRYVNILFSMKRNKYKALKEKFQNYLISVSDEKSYLLAKSVFSTVF